jgi:hypothetical protein
VCLPREIGIIVATCLIVKGSRARDLRLRLRVNDREQIHLSSGPGSLSALMIRLAYALLTPAAFLGATR